MMQRLQAQDRAEHGGVLIRNGAEAETNGGKS